ncbi:hypothetical protein [Sorangium cellulosum]|uniref:hypothetical protein n=1 Tax=Sorangium cellulosum TaxID=56 RepID=UPI0002D52E2F|nr:hypothetical protein [Sorangium cellulosum]
MAGGGAEAGGRASLWRRPPSPSGSRRCSAARASPSASRAAAATSTLAAPGRWSAAPRDAGAGARLTAAGRDADAVAAAPGRGARARSGRPFSPHAVSSMASPSPFCATRTTTRSVPGWASTVARRVTCAPPAA